MSKIKLPRTYSSRSEKYNKFNGLPKLSYSQYSSWKDPQYKDQYILQYFLGLNLDSGIWAEYGNKVGTFIEAHAKGEDLEGLSNEDKDVLKSLNYPENAIYEDEIVIDCGDFVIQGFTDKTKFNSENSLEILDYKTGNVTKESFYSSDDYQQTALYCYGKEKEGFTIDKSGVCLLGRKGNGMDKYPLKLSGEVIHIDTPYTKERGEKIIADITKVVNEISDEYVIFLKYFGGSLA